MTAAILALAAAVAASIGGLVVLALVARNAERNGGDARAAVERLRGELAIATAAIATEQNRADQEQRRADALDDLLSSTIADLPVAGARERVLARWRDSSRGDAAAGVDPSAMPADPAAGAAIDRDALIDPDDL